MLDNKKLSPDKPDFDDLFEELILSSCIAPQTGRMFGKATHQHNTPPQHNQANRPSTTKNSIETPIGGNNCSRVIQEIAFSTGNSAFSKRLMACG
jgi:hypothetical protein